MFRAIHFFRLRILRQVASWIFNPTAVTAILSLCVWYGSWKWVPINNDEAIHFQPIACTMFPFAELHKFREACGAKDLTLWGIRLPLRSFHYAGATSGLFFLPLWWLINNEVAIRIWGALVWLLNSILLARIINVSWAISTSVVMLSVPVIVQSVIDTGPTSFQFFTLQLSLYLFLKGIRTSKWPTACFLFTASGLSAFISAEQKFFVVYAMPLAVLLFTIGNNNSLHKPGGILRQVKRLAVGAVIFGLVAGSLLVSLLNAKVAGGGTYLNVIRQVGKRHSLADISSWTESFLKLYTTYFMYPSNYAHRNYGISFHNDVPQFRGEGSFVVLFPVLVLITILLIVDRRCKCLLLVLCCLLASIASLFWTASSVGVWAGHHVLYSHILLFIGLTLGVRELLPKFHLTVVGIISCILFSQFYSLWRIKSSSPEVHSDPTRSELFTLVDTPSFASRHLVVHLKWGTYFIDALFGPPSQAVTWIEGPLPAELSAKASKAGRKLAFITLTDLEWARIANARGLTRYATSSSGKWELWIEP